MTFIDKSSESTIELFKLSVLNVSLIVSSIYSILKSDTWVEGCDSITDLIWFIPDNELIWLLSNTEALDTTYS